MPAVVRHADDRDSLLLALVENVAREQLSPVEEARAYSVLMDEFVLTLGEVADRVGRSKPAVANRLRLLDLPDDVLGMVERRELTEGHARAVLAVPGQDERRALASLIVRRGLSVRAAEQAARWAGARQRPRKRSSPVDPALAARVKASIELLFGKPAKVSRGKLEIAFADEHELEELAEALERAVATTDDAATRTPSLRADMRGRGSLALFCHEARPKVAAPERKAKLARETWAIVDSNHGPPPYQSGALTD